MTRLDQLATKDCLLKWNVQVVSKICEFYGTQPETRDHLFFSCASIGRILQVVLGAVNLNHELVNWLLQQCGSTLDLFIYRLLWTEYIYSIWIEWNKYISNNKSRSEEELMFQIVHTVWLKVSTLPYLWHQLWGSPVVTILGITCTWSLLFGFLHVKKICLQVASKLHHHSKKNKIK